MGTEEGKTGNGKKKPISKKDLDQLNSLEDNLRYTEKKYERNFDQRQLDYMQASRELKITIGDAKTAIDDAKTAIDETKTAIDDAKKKSKL